jgi:hypothetical protein
MAFMAVMMIMVLSRFEMERLNLDGQKLGLAEEER